MRICCSLTSAAAKPRAPRGPCAAGRAVRPIGAGMASCHSSLVGHEEGSMSIHARARRQVHDCSAGWLWGVPLGAYFLCAAMVPAAAQQAAYGLASKANPNAIGLHVFWTQTTGVDAKLRYEFDIKYQASLDALKIPRVKEWSTTL